MVRFNRHNSPLLAPNRSASSHRCGEQLIHDLVKRNLEEGYWWGIPLLRLVFGDATGFHSFPSLLFILNFPHSYLLLQQVLVAYLVVWLRLCTWGFCILDRAFSVRGYCTSLSTAAAGASENRYRSPAVRGVLDWLSSFRPSGSQRSHAPQHALSQWLSKGQETRLRILQHVTVRVFPVAW